MSKDIPRDPVTGEIDEGYLAGLPQGDHPWCKLQRLGFAERVTFWLRAIWVAVVVALMLSVMWAV